MRVEKRHWQASASWRGILCARELTSGVETLPKPSLAS